MIGCTACKKRFTKDPFPVVLHDMLSDIEEKELSDAISWLPNGRGFIISKPKDLVKQILPK